MITLSKADEGKVVAFNGAMQYGVIYKVYDETHPIVGTVSKFPVLVIPLPLPIPDYIVKNPTNIELSDGLQTRSYTIKGTYTPDGSYLSNFDIKQILDTPEDCIELNKVYFANLVIGFLRSKGLTEASALQVAAKAADTLIDIIRPVS